VLILSECIPDNRSYVLYSACHNEGAVHTSLGIENSPLQCVADNRVRVRLNGWHFVPAVHNHEAEVHFGVPFWRYGSPAPAVRIDLVRTGDRLDVRNVPSSLRVRLSLLLQKG